MAAVEAVPGTRALDDAARRRLRDLVLIFLDEKEISGMGGFEVDATVRYWIAVQACLLVLELGIERYDGWTSIYVYPDAFQERDSIAGEDGVHRHRGVFAGVAMQGGALALAWQEVEHGIGVGNDGENVVLHEFAHKIDMQDGAANGVPPLPEGIDPGEWQRAFAEAFEELRDDVDDGRRTRIDPYGATDPAEFFAVLSETFFEKPRTVRREMPAVYDLLARFYGQDPLAQRTVSKR